jgi:predicted acyl esterase
VLHINPVATLICRKNRRLIDNSFKIGAGEKLRLDVSSSCVPHFLVHPNRKGAMTEQTGADIADNTLYCSNSKLILFAD